MTTLNFQLNSWLCLQSGSHEIDNLWNFFPPQIETKPPEYLQPLKGACRREKDKDKDKDKRNYKDKANWDQPPEYLQALEEEYYIFLSLHMISGT